MRKARSRVMSGRLHGRRRRPLLNPFVLLAIVAAAVAATACGDSAVPASSPATHATTSGLGPQAAAATTAPASTAPGHSATTGQPAAEACPHGDRLAILADFFAGWSTGDASRMPVAFFGTPAPWGLRLPRRSGHWPLDLESPATHDVADVRVWLARRIEAGDRVTLLYVQSSTTQPGVTGGTLSYRRSAPDIRAGRRAYGVAKFEVTCEGVSAVSGGRSWWTPLKLIRLCHPGAQFHGALICGVLPSGEIGT